MAPLVQHPDTSSSRHVLDSGVDFTSGTGYFNALKRNNTDTLIGELRGFFRSFSRRPRRPVETDE